MNTFFSLVALLFGIVLSLVAYRLIPLEKWVNPAEMEDWHDKYGKIFKIAGPIVAVIGLLFLIFR